MRGWSLWAWRITLAGTGLLGASFFLVLLLRGPGNAGDALYPIAGQLAAVGMQVTSLEAGAVSFEDAGLRIHLYWDDPESEVLILAESAVAASTVGWSAINEWNRDTTLVKIYSDANGLVVFEAGLPAGFPASPNVIVELVQYLRDFAAEFLTQNAPTARPATEI